MLSQPSYIKKLLQKFNMENCRPSKTPMETKPPSAPDPTSEDIIKKKPYRELVGSLMHLMLSTRPDLSFSVNYLSRFQSCATNVHWTSLKRILRYLQATQDMKLCFPRISDQVLVTYADADWANDEDRKSTSGFLIKIFGSTIIWTTRKQTTIALSSTEAEYVSLVTAAQDLLWTKTLLQELKIDPGIPVIYEDNQPCIKSLEKWEHKRLKHIDIKYNFVRNLICEKVISVQYIESENQIADILTKSLNATKFKRFCTDLSLVSLP